MWYCHHEKRNVETSKCLSFHNSRIQQGVFCPCLFELFPQFYTIFGIFCVSLSWSGHFFLFRNRNTSIPDSSWCFSFFRRPCLSRKAVIPGSLGKSCIVSSSCMSSIESSHTSYTRPYKTELSSLVIFWSTWRAISSVLMVSHSWHLSSATWNVCLLKADRLYFSL